MKRETFAEHYGSFENYQRHELKKLLWEKRLRLPIDILRYAAAVIGRKDTASRCFRKMRLLLCIKLIKEISGELEQCEYVNGTLAVLWKVHKDEEYGKRKVH